MNINEAHDLLQEYFSEQEWNIVEGELIWKDKETPLPDLDKLAEFHKKQLEVKYKQERRVAILSIFPIEEQLEAIMEFFNGNEQKLEAILKKIKEIKLKYPKPTPNKTV